MLTINSLNDSNWPYCDLPLLSNHCWEDVCGNIIDISSVKRFNSQETSRMSIRCGGNSYLIAISLGNVYFSSFIKIVIDNHKYTPVKEPEIKIVNITLINKTQRDRFVTSQD